VHGPWSPRAASPTSSSAAATGSSSSPIAAATSHALTPAARAALERQVRERPQHRHGVHRYAPEDFGFRREELDERYAAYRAHFGVALERK
jgi:hypothetical protein